MILILSKSDVKTNVRFVELLMMTVVCCWVVDDDSGLGVLLLMYLLCCWWWQESVVCCWCRSADCVSFAPSSGQSLPTPNAHSSPLSGLRVRVLQQPFEEKLGLGPALEALESDSELSQGSVSPSGFSSPHSGSSLSIPFPSVLPSDGLTVSFVQDTSKYWYKPDIAREQGTVRSVTADGRLLCLMLIWPLSVLTQLSRSWRTESPAPSSWGTVTRSEERMDWPWRCPRHHHQLCRAGEVRDHQWFLHLCVQCWYRQHIKPCVIVSEYTTVTAWRYIYILDKHFTHSHTHTHTHTHTHIQTQTSLPLWKRNALLHTFKKEHLLWNNTLLDIQSNQNLFRHLQHFSHYHSLFTIV